MRRITQVSARWLSICATALTLWASPAAAVASDCPALIVNGGVTQSAAENTSVTLQGHPTWDTWNWEFVSSAIPGVSAVSLATSPDKRQAYFVAPAVDASGGALVFRLTVTKLGCGTKSQNVTVNITNVAATNTAPKAVATASASTVNEGQSFTLSGAASTDAEGNALTYAWDLMDPTDGTATPVAGSSPVPTVSLTAPGSIWPDKSITYAYRLTVSDGTLSSIAFVSVTVKWVNDPPVAGLVCPSAAVAEGAVVTLDGSSSTDPDDGIASYSWTQITGPAPATALTGGAQAQFTAPHLYFGKGNELQFQLTISDVTGASDSRTCTVTVKDVTKPVISVPADISMVASSETGADVGFTVSAADDWDGDLSDKVVCSNQPGRFLGDTTVTCNVNDAAGNAADSASFKISVKYAFAGFFAPVENPVLLNTVKGGSTVPLKWKLSNATGGDITSLTTVAAGYPHAVPTDCGFSTSLETAIDQTTTGGTSLRYDTMGRQFVFNWQTLKSPGSCWRMDLKLADGTYHSANFKLK